MASGGKGANRGVGGFGGGWRMALLAGDRGGLLRGGTGAARGSQAYLGPRALCRARRHDDRLGVPRLRGDAALSLYSPEPGPARQGRERLTADWRRLAAVMPHRVSSAPARRPAGHARLATMG